MDDLLNIAFPRTEAPTNAAMSDPIFDGLIPEDTYAASHHDTSWPILPDLDPNSRLVTRAEGEALFKRILAMTSSGGDTEVTVRSSYIGNLRWGRNRPTTSGITMDRWVTIVRQIDGRTARKTVNQLDDGSLKKAVQIVEQLVKQQQEEPLRLSGPHQYVQPPIWSESTALLTAQSRSEVAQGGVKPVVDAKLFATGYVATNIETWGIYNTLGLGAYAAATGAMYAQTVRNPEGTGSGWAGLTHTDWTKINAPQLATRALEKCIASANPRAIEPGRYTAILDAEVVAAFMLHALEPMDRQSAEKQLEHPYNLEQDVSRIGQKIMDERLTIRTDPMDPDAPYIPFDNEGFPFRPVTWVERGILKELSYNRAYAEENLGSSLPLPNPLACRVITNGPETSLENMIASTERGIFVTRVGMSTVVDPRSIQMETVTRDGLWLVERGKISMPVKNMRILESPLFIFNNVLQIDRPQRVWGRAYQLPLDNRPSMVVNEGRIPFVMPAMKIQDFNFLMSTDTV